MTEVQPKILTADEQHYLNRCREIISEFRSGKNHFLENPDPNCDLGYLQMVLAIEYSPKNNGEIWGQMYDKFDDMLKMFYREGFLKDQDFPEGKAIIEYRESNVGDDYFDMDDGD